MAKYWRGGHWRNGKWIPGHWVNGKNPAAGCNFWLIGIIGLGAGIIGSTVKARRK